MMSGNSCLSSIGYIIDNWPLYLFIYLMIFSSADSFQKPSINCTCRKSFPCESLADTKIQALSFIPLLQLLFNFCDWLFHQNLYTLQIGSKRCKITPYFLKLFLKQPFTRIFYVLQVYDTILDYKLWSELRHSSTASISYKGQCLEYEQNYGLSLQNDIVLSSNIWQDEAVG